MNEISICISEGHKTTANILKRKAFTVSMAEAGQIIACDYVGIVSGNKVPDKFARAGFHATRSEFVDAPLIDELSVAVECKLKDYNPETCILRGEIVNSKCRCTCTGSEWKSGCLPKLFPVNLRPVQ